MANPKATANGSNALPEFMTSASVGDFFAEWLTEQVRAYAATMREQGNSRALGWELRTLERQSNGVASFVSNLLAETE